MPTVDEVWEQIKFLREHGKGHEKALLVLPGLANRRKMKSRPKRFSIGGDEAFILRLLASKERFLAEGNKTVKLEIMCALWELPSEEQMEYLSEHGADEMFLFASAVELYQFIEEMRDAQEGSDSDQTS